MNKTAESGIRKLLVILTAIFFLAIFLSCTSTKKDNFKDDIPVITKENQFPKETNLTCIFAGDVMAHKPNWSHGRYDEIYASISQDLKAADLAFANLETPVTDSREYSTYPNFNVHSEYADAAINAGFNVFSTANNHTNDQELEGIKETRSYFQKKITETKGSERPVYAAGLKETENGPLSYQIIEINGWKILFVAITEILNRPICSKWIDYIVPTNKGRANFAATVKKLREDNPVDLFVLSVHCAEEEYIRTVAQQEKDFYQTLLAAGVDVIWANHPHVARSWDLIQNSQQDTSKMIFYSLGNTISAQRYFPNFKDPGEDREYTGDGYIIRVVFNKSENGVKVMQVDPILISTIVESDGMCLIEKLDDSLIKRLNDSNRKTWAAYLEKRIKYMEDTKGNLIWQ